LIKNKFIKTIEIIPSRYKIDNLLLNKILKYSKSFDFLDLACAPMANLRISPISFAHNLIIKGINPSKIIINISTRDKNSLALQSDILGVANMKINKLLLVKGDPISIGNSKKSKEVFELNTNDLISLVNKLNSGKDYSNNDTNYKPKFKIGSTLNIDLPRKKIERTIALRSLNGSNFFITQPLYSEEDFINLCKLSNKNSYKVLAGIFPIKNAKTFKNLNHKIDGINRNNTLFKKLKISSEEDFLKISSEHLINLLIKYKKDLDGVHIMTAGDLKLASKISEKI
jgi:homocysteine S-methyltransferase